MSPRDFLGSETLQLAALRMADLLNTPLEPRFNRLAHLARCALGVKAATISLFDEEREWVKAGDGWDLAALPLAQSLASVLARNGVPVLVDDTIKDERCRHCDLVTKSPEVRFVAVYPLTDQSDNVVGAVVAYDTAPRQSTEEMSRILGEIGQLAQRELSLVEVGTGQEQLLVKLSSARRQAMIDDLTRLWNRRGGLDLLHHAITGGTRQSQGKGLGVCIADLDRFKDMNDRYGHSAGDILLKRAAATMVDSVRPADVVCRLGGDEFLLIIPGVSASELTTVLERVRTRVAAHAVRIHEATVCVTLSFGAYLHPPHEPTTIQDLLRGADAAMYQAKAAGRNVVVVS
jgi:diguanylate cyclase (GGDEF)-like protein